MGGSQQFSATVSGSANASVTWFVNGKSGGSAATGMINSAGLYTPPNSLPSPNTVTVKAVAAADSNVSASITVTQLNPIPVLGNIAPQTTAVGTFVLTINGANYVPGAQVLFAGSPLNTMFLSSTQLTATGTASSAGTFAIAVMNPNPGSASSNLHGFQSSARSGSHDNQFYRQPIVSLSGHASNFDLDGGRCFLLRYLSGCRSNTRHERDCYACANDHIYACRNESVRPHHCHSYSSREVRLPEFLTRLLL
jgi:hypothetical protein